jgi:uncharacterized repeat protein (TIGR01451 family)
MRNKRVISLVIVFTLLLSIFNVAFAESGTVYAWNDGSWKNSANDDWDEGDWIPIKLIPNISDTTTTTPAAMVLTVGMEYTKNGSEPIGFDGGKEWEIGTNSSTLGYTDLGVSINVDNPKKFVSTNGSEVLHYTITVPSEALIALANQNWALYGKIHASEVGTENIFAGGIISSGASSWNGKNLQVEYVEANQTVSFGINEAPAKYGIIIVDKKVTGNMDNENDVFTFDIMDGEVIVDTVTASGITDGVSGELLVGDYTVVERDPSPYTLVGENNKPVTVEVDFESFVEFTNDYSVPELGTIRIDKTVTGNAASENDVFTFDIMDGEVVVDTVTASGITDGLAVDLSVGDYTVVERDPSPYELVGGNNKPANVTWGGESLVEFTNDRTVEVLEYGIIIVDKKVTGNMDNENDVFTFDIMDGEVIVDTVTASGITDGVSGELLVGDYTVVERDPSPYTLVGENNKPVTVEVDFESFVEFTNDYSVPELGTIRIDKTVTGNAASENDVFTFDIMDGEVVVDTVTASGITDGLAVDLSVGDYTVVERDPSPYELVGGNNKPANVTWGGESLVEFTNDRTVEVLEYGIIIVDKKVTGNMDNENDVFTFDIMDGEVIVDTVTASGITDGVSGELLVGDYTVVERDPSPYILVGENNKPVTVEVDFESFVEFTNDYSVPELGTIRIDKTVTGNAASENDVFTFDIMDGEVIVDTVTASGITDGVSGELLVGDYTVVERDPSPYTLEGDNDKSVTVELEKESLVEFTNEYIIEPRYGLTIDKIVDDSSVYTNVEVTYTVTLENTGNQDLYIDFTDIDGFDLNEYESFELLAESTTTRAFTTSYSSTGDKVNVAEATYYGPQENPVTVSDSAIVDVNSRPSTSTDYRMSITKTADQDEVMVGDTITYTITVKNIDDGTLREIVVTDDLVELNEEIAVLSEGDSVVFTVEYIALEEGLLENTAKAVDDRAGTKTATAEVLVKDDTPLGLPGLTIDKSIVGDKTEFFPEEIVEFKIIVTNTGNTKLENIIVEDPMVGLFGYRIDELEPNTSEEIFVNMTVTEDAEDFTNVATATTGNLIVSDDADVTIGEIIVEVDIPLDVPNTGAAPLMLIYGLGALGVGTGWSIFDRKKNR